MTDFTNKLPAFCAAVHQTTGEFIILKRGVTGYWPGEALGVTDQETADYFNQKRGVTSAQVEAMLIGSVFGFDVPGADPDCWEGQVR